MRCSVCGNELKINEQVCPYCKTPRGYVSRKDEKELERMLSLIEKKYVGVLNDNLTDDSDLNKNLLEKIDNILVQLNDFKAEYQIKSDAASERLNKIEQDLQQKLPMRKSVTENIQNYERMSASEAVDFFLNKREVPEVNFAAYKIRTSVEQQLTEFYKYKFYYIKNQGYKFVKRIISVDGKSVPEGFSESHERLLEAVNNDRKKAKELDLKLRDLNLFIHESRSNDNTIKQKYGTKENQVKFLETIFKELKKYNLIKE